MTIEREGKSQGGDEIPRTTRRMLNAAAKDGDLMASQASRWAEEVG
jgi:hypothetical protein